MSENLEPREEQEDVIDLMSSLIREIAESGTGNNLAQLVQNAKGLWQKGERAGAYWMLEAFTMGQKDVLASASQIAKDGTNANELTKRVCEDDDGIYQKLGRITHEMGKDSNSLM